MVDNKKDRKVLGRGLSALISSPMPNNVISQSNIDSNNTAKNVNELFAKNFEREKEKEKELNNSKIVQNVKVQDDTTMNNKDVLIDIPNDKKINNISLSEIITNSEQPREDFSEKALNELAVSIKKHGILQPILVRKHGEKYEIVAGERRYRAAKLAGLTEVPVILKDLEDNDAYEIAVIENIQRENLNPIEEAKAYKKLLQNGKITQSELSEKIGKDRSSISNILRILELSSDIQEMIKNRDISLGHAKVLLSLKKNDVQKSFAKKIVQEGLSVRELEKLVSEVWVLDAGRAYKDLSNSEKKQSETNDGSKFSEILDILRQKLGTRVNIKHQKNGHGKLEVEYYSEEELGRVVQIITKEVVNI